MTKDCPTPRTIRYRPYWRTTSSKGSHPDTGNPASAPSCILVVIIIVVVIGVLIGGFRRPAGSAGADSLVRAPSCAVVMRWQSRPASVPAVVIRLVGGRRFGGVRRRRRARGRDLRGHRPRSLASPIHRCDRLVGSLDRFTLLILLLGGRGVVPGCRVGWAPVPRACWVPWGCRDGLVLVRVVVGPRSW